MRPHRQSGFTLVELMITIALLAFLLMLGNPLTATWTAGAQQQSAESLIREGIGRAKALALRNPQQKNGGLAAVVLRLCSSDSTRELKLYRDPDATCSTSNADWVAQLPRQPLIEVGDDDFSCLTFDNRATPKSDGGCTTESISVKATAHATIEIPLL